MSGTTFEDLFIEELNDMYDAEKKITKALPKMAKAATSEELVAAFEEHLAETEEQITRLEQVFESIGIKPGRKKCEAMEGLLEEGKEMIESDREGAVKDAGLISAAQKVEHYEMAGYGCLRTWASLLGYSDAAELLQQTLDEEGGADQKLTEIAESLNIEAQEESEEDEEDSKPKPRRRV
ncbi:MAG: ferritin-like domain-containing protein, partial [Planctomycetaceae bacterium]|nr:ferritin-like domain-containing protein [Planctomycetaceae bacterium]